MASIAGLPVTVFSGRLQRAGRPHRLSTQAAVDGADVLFDGWQTEPADIVTRLDSPDDPTESGEIFRALIDSTATVIDGVGQRWEQVRILDARSTTDRLASGRWLLTTRWRMLPRADEPA
jgi:hypothetical protein